MVRRYGGRVDALFLGKANGTIVLDLTGHILILGPIVHLPTADLQQNVVIIVDKSSRLFRIRQILLFTYGFLSNSF